MRRLLLALITIALAACASTDKPLVDDTLANPYAKHYVSRMPPPQGKEEAPPQIFRGTDRVADYQMLLEDGYDLLGYSSFEAGDVPPGQLADYASNLKADVVLVYTTKSGDTPASVKLERARERARQAADEAPPATASPGPTYAYFASYWVKLPMPLLGVHVQRDSKADSNTSGLDVIAVIKNSPAAVAGIQRGDVLLRLGDVELRKPEALTEAAQRYAGQRTELVVHRMGEARRVTVTLNGG